GRQYPVGHRTSWGHSGERMLLAGGHAAVSLRPTVDGFFLGCVCGSRCLCSESERTLPASRADDRGHFFRGVVGDPVRMPALCCFAWFGVDCMDCPLCPGGRADALRRV